MKNIWADNSSNICGVKQIKSWSIWAGTRDFKLKAQQNTTPPLFVLLKLKRTKQFLICCEVLCLVVTSIKVHKPKF